MELPSSTLYNRFLPKESFYKNTEMSAKLRQDFVDEISRVTWKHKISPDTVNIEPGEYNELQVFEIAIKTPEISNNVLKHIDMHIPYPILFIIKKDNLGKACIAFKQFSVKTGEKTKVDLYFDTGWQKELTLVFKGRSVDEIYKNYIFQIEPVLQNLGYVDLREAIESYNERLAIQSKIDGLARRIRTEVSQSKKQDLARERFNLEQQLAGLSKQDS